MRDNNRSSAWRKGPGAYIGLGLCALALGAGGYLYSREAPEAPEAAVAQTYEDVLVGIQDTADVPVLATQPPSLPAATVPAATQPTAAGESEGLKTVSPVSGTEIFGYSMEALSYNQTTRDWRVHNGIDLAAEAGTEVRAAAEGEVWSVSEDPSLGHCVVLRHCDGYVTTYACLSPDIAVSPGDRVALGQAIGCVGDSAITESTLGTHVHFSVSRYDEPMDPAAFLALSR